MSGDPLPCVSWWGRRKIAHNAGESVSAQMAEMNVLAAIAHADRNPNATQQALVDHYATAPDGWRATDAVAFSSARKWSATRFADQGWWALGAPEVMLRGAAYEAVEPAVRASAGPRSALPTAPRRPPDP